MSEENMNEETETGYSELRSADLSRLVTVLREESVRRYDVVVPAQGIAMAHDGSITVARHTEAQMDENGVTPAGLEILSVAPTIVAEEQLGAKLGIPRQYWKRCAAGHTDLLAENVNHWLDNSDESYFLRTLAASNGLPGVLRAVLSDRFRPIDNLDVVMAALEGIRAAGNVDPSDLEIEADLSLRRMYIRVNAPNVFVDVPDLVGRYRDPSSGRLGHDFGVVSAGCVIKNSDLGQGAFHILPRIGFLVCRNGMVRTVDGVRSVHLGGQHDDGVVDWSDETQRRTLAVISSKTTDAVRTFLSPDYLQNLVAELRGMSRKEVDDPTAAIENVTKTLRYTQEESAAIMSAFIKGGDLTPLGVAQAFTYVAQSMSADRSAEMEADAWQAMTLAAR